MRYGTALAVGVAGAVAAAPLAALAQQPGGAQEVAEGPSTATNEGAETSTSSFRSADEEARRIFREGRAAYQASRFEEALEAFRRAYVLSNRPQLLYNVGMAALRLGRHAEALEAFRGYLRLSPPEADNRAEVVERVRELEHLAETSPDEEAPAGRDQGPPERARSGGSWAPWIMVGAGGLLALGGTALVLLGEADRQEVTDPPQGARWDELRGTAERGRAFYVAGEAALGLGLAAVVAGLLWRLVPEGPEAAERVALSPGCEVGGSRARGLCLGASATSFGSGGM